MRQVTQLSRPSRSQRQNSTSGSRSPPLPPCFPALWSQRGRLKGSCSTAGLSAPNKALEKKRKEVFGCATVSPVPKTTLEHGRSLLRIWGRGRQIDGQRSLLGRKSVSAWEGDKQGSLHDHKFRIFAQAILRIMQRSQEHERL